MEIIVKLQEPAALPPGNNPVYQLYKRLDGPHSQSVRYEEEQNLSALPVFKPQFFVHTTRSLVATPTELSRILIYFKDIHSQIKKNDRLCGLTIRVPGYRSRGPEFDSRRYQIF
jgi:hypothetical protein